MTDAGNLLEEVWQHHEALRATRALPRLRLTRLATPVPERIGSRADLEQRIATLDTAYTGWCRRESRVVRTPCASLAEFGPPLDGEWVSLDGTTSIRLVFAGSVWQFFTLSEVPHGDAVLREDVAMLGHDGEILRYAVYWAGRVEDPAGLRRMACRLTGLGGKDTRV
nr:hypothetical protein [uncultured Rhodopila sp.]